MWRRAVVVIVGLLGTACAVASSPSRPVKSAGRDVITAAEIVASRVTDVYQAVIQLRPEFLRRRAAAAVPAFATPRVLVYLDDFEYGTAESLRLIPLQRVRLIRYLSPIEADIRFGRAHPAGAILVVTMK